MKIGIITPSVSRGAGGIVEIVRSYAQTINKINNVEMSVFGLEDEYTKNDIKDWQPLHPKVFSTFGPKSFGFAPGMIQSLKKSDMEICHLHILWKYTSIALLRWWQKKRKPYLISTHGLLETWALNNSKLRKQVAASLYERACLEQSSCIHAYTELEYNSIRKYGLKNPVCIIPSGIDLPYKDYTCTSPPWKDVVEPGKKVLLYLGRIHPKKGLVPLVEAWGKVVKDNPATDWNLVIAGWDQYDHEALLKQMVKTAGLEKSVHFIGPQFSEHKEHAYYHADAFTLPSFSEGMPMVVLEAWSYMLPILMTPECHFPQGYSTGSAIYIEPTAESVATGLQTLFNMREKDLKQMGENGRQLVEKNFTWERAAKDMHRVYKWLLGEGEIPENVILK